jgi:DNA-binding Lrp family transcriptional regulator
MYDVMIKDYVDVLHQEYADLCKGAIMQKGRVDHASKTRKNSSLTKESREPGLKNTSIVRGGFSGLNRTERIVEQNKVILHTDINLDRTGISIIEELLGNPNIKSSDLATRLRIPLSTIQRRRAKLESSYILRKAYKLDLARLGWREAQLLVTVQKGKCRNVANQLLKGFKNNVRSCTLRIGDPEVNVAADIIYRSSPELLGIIDAVKNMNFVSYVEWSEITEIVGENNIDARYLLESHSVRI